MQLFYLTSQKGGVGKTTVSWLIACAIKKLHPKARVAFIDGTHAQGSRSLSLAHEKEINNQGLGRVLATLQGGILPGMPWKNQEREIADAADRAMLVLKSVETPVLIDESLEVIFIPAAHVLLKSVMANWKEEQRGALLSLLTARMDYDYCLIDTIADPGGVLQESILNVADACVFLEDLRDYESLAGLGTLVSDARAAGVKIAGAVGNFLSPSVKLDGKKSKSKSAVALDVFTETCFDAKIEVLEVIRGNITSLANSLNVYMIGDKVASSMYVEMQRSPSNRKNLELLVQRIEGLAHRLEA
jgi:cellulose biosynthesis protein BcsQ